jgi:hypothetical protein
MCALGRHRLALLELQRGTLRHRAQFAIRRGTCTDSQFVTTEARGEGHHDRDDSEHATFTAFEPMNKPLSLERLKAPPPRR